MIGGDLALVRDGFIRDINEIVLYTNNVDGLKHALSSQDINQEYVTSDFSCKIIIKPDDTVKEFGYQPLSKNIKVFLDNDDMVTVEELVREATPAQLKAMELPEPYKTILETVIKKVKNATFTVDGKPIWKIYS
jgi:hypothetical protein